MELDFTPKEVGLMREMKRRALLSQPITDLAKTPTFATWARKVEEAGVVAQAMREAERKGKKK